MSLIGLDVGTTGCKATLFEFSGRLIGSVSREYAVDFPQPGWAEQDAEYVFELVKSSIKELMQAFQPHVEAIGLSVQGEAVIPVDEDGYAMLPAILGMDTRTSQENAWLVKHFGATWLFEHTGMPVHTINTLPKLLWLKEHHPQVWRTARSFLLYEDFFINKMTGKPAISRCLASRTQMFDLQQDGWSSDILAALELE